MKDDLHANTTTVRSAVPITGYMVILGPGHSIAIYDRLGKPYVAEFRGRRGEFINATTWYRLNAGTLRYCHNRRTASRSTIPLTSEILEAIERLHCESELREEQVLTGLRSIATLAQRPWISLITALRGRVAKRRRTFG